MENSHKKILNKLQTAKYYHNPLWSFTALLIVKGNIIFLINKRGKFSKSDLEQASWTKEFTIKSLLISKKRAHKVLLEQCCSNCINLL